MKINEDVKKMRMIAEEACALVKKFGGSFSGEHGDGIVRSEFIEKICQMEGAEDGVTFSSGMGSVYGTFAALLNAGDPIISSRSVFGSSCCSSNFFFADNAGKVTAGAPLTNCKAASNGLFVVISPAN